MYVNVAVGSAFLLVGALLGLVAYEVLVRLSRGKHRGGEKPSTAQVGLAEQVRVSGASARYMHKALANLSAVVERFAPIARADAGACRDRLTRAGVALAPETWRALRVVSAAVGGLGAGAVVTLLPAASVFVCIAVVCGGLFCGWMIPALALSCKEKRRRDSIERGLPDAMELLGIALAAGSPVEQCFREVAASLDGPIAEELALVDQEVNLLGHARETALENMAARCHSQDVGAFVAHITQAITQGSSIAEGLAAQATIARETAQADALERIRKMPTKLDIVLSMCFLPPTVALVVIPTVVNLLDFLNDTMG